MMSNRSSSPSSTTPRITVLMPVFNGMPHVRHAVESLIEQTEKSFVAFVFNDGSTDETGRFLDGIRDPRFIVRHQANKGLAKTLNAMTEEVETEYVARMDADDVCFPKRFEQQLAFMDTHPEVAVLGSRQGYVEGERSKAQICLGFRTLVPSYGPPCSDPPYWHPRVDGHILVHSSVMMRTAALREVGGYPEIVPGQDLALWYQFARTRWKMANLDQMLILFRISEGGISNANLTRQYQTWCHIADSWERERNGESPISLEDFMRDHPLSGSELASMRGKAQLRNAMARYLEGRRVRGLFDIVATMFAHPALVIDKLKSRLRSAGHSQS